MLAASSDGSSEHNFLSSLGVKSNAAASRGANTEDWSIKNHRVKEDTRGVGWSFALGKKPSPDQAGANPDAQAFVVQDIEFIFPPADSGFEGYRLDCLLYRGDQQPLSLSYPLS